MTKAAGRWAGIAGDGEEIVAMSQGQPFAAGLTPTQVRVLQGVHSGRLNKEIAFDLGIAEATVKAHMTALMRKLKVRNRTQVAMATRTMDLSTVR